MSTKEGSMKKPHGIVCRTSQNDDGTKAWRGVIWDGLGERLFDGRQQRSRSAAFAEMEAANKDQELGAELVAPSPDEKTDAA